MVTDENRIRSYSWRHKMHLFENGRKICIMASYPMHSQYVEYLRRTLCTYASIACVLTPYCIAAEETMRLKFTFSYSAHYRNEKLCISLSAVQVRVELLLVLLLVSVSVFRLPVPSDLWWAAEFIARIMMRFAGWMHDAKWKFVGRQMCVWCVVYLLPSAQLQPYSYIIFNKCEAFMHTLKWTIWNKISILFA